MRFNRMPLEEWFDQYQYEIKYDIGESATSCLSFEDVGLSLDKMKIRYGYHRGNPLLREKIAEIYPGFSANDILVTNGAAEALFDLAATLLNPRDHIIVQHPNYPSNYEAPRSLGCDVELFSLDFSRGFEWNIDLLESCIRPNTRVISLTYPNNPTGKTIDEAGLRRIIEVVEAKGCWLIFDETYRELAFEEKLPTTAALSKRAISVSTVSKSYGLPGVRIGWMATKDRSLLDRVLATREQVSICNSVIGEEIALAILRRGDEFLAAIRDVVARNLRVVKEWIRDKDWLRWVEPTAGVVCFPRIEKGVLENPEDLFVLLAEKYKTFVIPGRCFECDNHFFRLGFGGDLEHLQIGLENVDRAVRELRKGHMQPGEKGRRRK